MYSCSNCERKVDLSADQDGDCVVVREAGAVIAAICPACLDQVKTTKIVMGRKHPSRLFAFDSLLNVEVFK